MGGLAMASMLRNALAEKRMLPVMAAHSPLSALLAEEAGFDGLWASGFELAALYGLPDMSLTTMTQHLDMVRAMAARTSLPVIADVDTGFGNAINVIHTVSEYERAGAAAIVIEDRTFPKTTSLAVDGRQDLLRVEEFQGKIEAAVATRTSPDFLIVARTEALIAGLGQAEALRRAAAYERAGADMILIHSKQRSPEEIEDFAQAWSGNAPIVIVPTAYPEMDEKRALVSGKIKIIIYGNHAIRASVTAMKDIFSRIQLDRGIQRVNKDIVPVDEIFRLQGMKRVAFNEKTYLR
jgi:phosphoenolpyruvate phosphomutase